MQFESTRGNSDAKGFDDVLLSALADDGGLFVPTELPRLRTDAIRALRGLSYTELAGRLLPHLIGTHVEPRALQDMIDDAYSTFHHPAVAPMKQLNDQIWLMEMFHGPTLAFKDFALQLLGRLLDHELLQRGEKAVIVGATSGDTGPAAIEACRDRDAIDLFMLHPKGWVSNVQRRQMTSVDAPNIHNLAVTGTFDDCQALVKQLLNDPSLAQQRRHVTAVNSINWARVAAQVVYYFYAALALGAPDRAVNFAVPTGNFGNVYAGHLARRMGLPIDRLIIASNRNDILTRFFETGTMEARAVEPSLSPSMNIQISSNFERLLFELYDRDGIAIGALMETFRTSGTFSVTPDVIARARTLFSAQRLSDEETLAVMLRFFEECGELLDPHTAIGVGAAASIGAACDGPIIVLGTAHPAKFPDAVAQATGQEPNVPDHLAVVFELPEKGEDIAPCGDMIRALILNSGNPEAA
jgi:threonine synthase